MPLAEVTNLPIYLIDICVALTHSLLRTNEKADDKEPGCRRPGRSVGTTLAMDLPVLHMTRATNAHRPVTLWDRGTRSARADQRPGRIFAN